MTIRKATQNDLPALVRLLAQDKLGKLREDASAPLSPKYRQAFDNIAADPNQELVVLEAEGEVIGTLQLTFIPYLTYQGGIRAQIEAVRVHADHQRKGIGKHLFEWAIERTRQKGAHVVQLTTDKERPNALAFYQALGFVNSHEGLKLHLP